MIIVIIAALIITSRGGVPSRNKYVWPFSRYSAWNMPIGSNAQYVPAGLQIPTEGSDQYGRWSAGKKVRADTEFIGVNPEDPIKKVSGTKVVHVPLDMHWDGTWNGCAALLQKDGKTIIQGQPLKLTVGGNPSWQFAFERPAAL